MKTGNLQWISLRNTSFADSESTLNFSSTIFTRSANTIGVQHPKEWLCARFSSTCIKFHLSFTRETNRTSSSSFWTPSETTRSTASDRVRLALETSWTRYSDSSQASRIWKNSIQTRSFKASGPTPGEAVQLPSSNQTGWRWPSRVFQEKREEWSWSTLRRSSQQASRFYSEVPNNLIENLKKNKKPRNISLQVQVTKASLLHFFIFRPL